MSCIYLYAHGTGGADRELFVCNLSESLRKKILAAREVARAYGDDLDYVAFSTGDEVSGLLSFIKNEDLPGWDDWMAAIEDLVSASDQAIVITKKVDEIIQNASNPGLRVCVAENSFWFEHEWDLGTELDFWYSKSLDFTILDSRPKQDMKKVPVFKDLSDAFKKLDVAPPPDLPRRPKRRRPFMFAR